MVDVTVYDRTSYEESSLIAERIGDTAIVVENIKSFIYGKPLNVVNP